MNRLERVILAHLLHREEYARAVLPFLKPEYFVDRDERNVFCAIQHFIDTFNAMPSKVALGIALEKDSKIGEDGYANAIEILDTLVEGTEQQEWLLETTERFCKDKAMMNAVSRIIAIMGGEEKGTNVDAAAAIFQEASQVGFDKSIGHDYFEDGDSRYAFYHNQTVERIPFDIELLNTITKGGLPRKTLTIFMAGINVGKSLIMCHHAKSCLLQGKNVLYITLEMAQEWIAERIDANLLNVTTDELQDLPREVFTGRLAKVREKAKGRLFIKEFPTAGAHAGHFRALLNDLRVKKNFVPDIVFIDYINLCRSEYITSGESTYALVKAVGEEIRGLAVEQNLAIVSATQLTRAGMKNSDADMTDVAESIGLPQLADLFLVVLENEELENSGQYLFKQLKNRLNKRNEPRRFMVGVDKSKFRLYDLEDAAQKDLTADTISSSQTATGPSPAAKKFFLKDRKPALSGLDSIKLEMDETP